MWNRACLTFLFDGIYSMHNHFVPFLIYFTPVNYGIISHPANNGEGERCHKTSSLFLIVSTLKLYARFRPVLYIFLCNIIVHCKVLGFLALNLACYIFLTCVLVFLFIVVAEPISTSLCLWSSHRPKQMSRPPRKAIF